MTPNSHTPDILLDKKLKWEIKTPKNSTRETLWRASQTATKQSENVIFYIKKLPIPEINSVRTLKNIFDTSRKIRRLKIITKTGRVIDFTK